MRIGGGRYEKRGGGDLGVVAQERVHADGVEACGSGFVLALRPSDGVSAARGVAAEIPPAPLPCAKRGRIEEGDDDADPRNACELAKDAHALVAFGDVVEQARAEDNIDGPIGQREGERGRDDGVGLASEQGVVGLPLAEHGFGGVEGEDGYVERCKRREKPAGS